MVIVSENRLVSCSNKPHRGTNVQLLSKLYVRKRSWKAAEVAIINILIIIKKSDDDVKTF